jgi:hypothetical protein
MICHRIQKILNFIVINLVVLKRTQFKIPKNRILRFFGQFFTVFRIWYKKMEMGSIYG